jgi:hypothetical protein
MKLIVFPGIFLGIFLRGFLRELRVSMVKLLLLFFTKVDEKNSSSFTFTKIEGLECSA